MFTTILKQSTTKWPFWKYIFGGVGSIVAVLLFGKNFFELPVLDSILGGFGVIFIIWFLRFTYLVIIHTISYIHNAFVDSIWGSAIIELKNAYSEVHFLRKKEDISDIDFMKTMILFCDTLKRIFDKKTKSNCCVSIKVPISLGTSLETLELKNLCRDSFHKTRDTEQYKSISHTIIGNTAYTKIVNKLLRGNQKHLAYINNDIHHSLEYENTSKECYENGILPYKSELVFPIVPIKGNEKERRNLMGFICIDCNAPNKFDEKRYDIPMIEGIADGIFDIFVKRNAQ